MEQLRDCRVHYRIRLPIELLFSPRSCRTDRISSSSSSRDREYYSEQQTTVLFQPLSLTALTRLLPP